MGPYIIPSGDITMEGINFPIQGTDNLGNTKIMKPGKNYKFPGSSVYEIPMMKKGGKIGCGCKGACAKCGGHIPKYLTGGSLPQYQIASTTVSPYKSQLDWDSLNRYNKDYNTFEGGEGAILPKGVSTGRLYTRDRSKEIFGELANMYPDANKIYSSGQLRKSGFADEYYDLYNFTDQYETMMNKIRGTAGTEEGITTPLKEQKIGPRHHAFFDKKVRGSRTVSGDSEEGRFYYTTSI